MSSRHSLSAIGFAAIVFLLFAAGCTASARKRAGPAVAEQLRAFPVEPPAWAGTLTPQEGAPAAPVQPGRDVARPVVLLAFKQVTRDEDSLPGGFEAGEAHVLDESVADAMFSLPDDPTTKRLSNMALCPDQTAWVAITHSRRGGGQVVPLGDRVFARVTAVTPQGADIQYEWQNASESGPSQTPTTWRVAGAGRLNSGQALMQRVPQENRQATCVIVRLMQVARPG